MIQKIPVTILTALILFAAGLYAQTTMEVIKLSGGSDQTLINSITKITFSGDNMIIGGVGKTQPLSDVRKVIFNDGLSGITQANAGVPETGHVSPNPFNPVTNVHFTLARKAPVSIAVYNTRGRKIAGLIDGVLEAGAHACQWKALARDGRPVSAGLYIVRMRVNGKTFNKKIVLAK